MCPSVYASEANSLSKHWIIDAPSRIEKDKRLEKYLRGVREVAGSKTSGQL